MDKEYIERGYLIKEAENILIYRMQSCMSHERIEDAVSTLEWLKYHAPAADVVEVRHGRWVWDETVMDWGPGGWVCSECKVKNDNIPEKPDTNPTAWRGSHYCPNCGAIMDLQEE